MEKLLLTLLLQEVILKANKLMLLGSTGPHSNIKTMAPGDQKAAQRARRGPPTIEEAQSGRAALRIRAGETRGLDPAGEDDLICPAITEYSHANHGKQ